MPTELQNKSLDQSLDRYHSLSHKYAEAFDGNADALLGELSEVFDTIVKTDDRLLLPLILGHIERERVYQFGASG
jgi:hypothetical protein